MKQLICIALWIKYINNGNQTLFCAIWSEITCMFSKPECDEHEFELVSSVRFQTKIAGWHDTLSLNLFIYLIQRPCPLWSSTIWWPKYKILVSTNILLNHTVESQSVCKDHERFQTGCRKHIGTVPLKSKLTVTCVSILETRGSILDSRNFRGSSLEFRWSRIEFKFGVEKALSLKVYTYLSF